MAHIKNLSNRAYISGSLKDKLSRFEMYRYSFIYAPTGYGKSKVIRTFFKNYPGYTVLWIDAESSREIFWDNFCNAVKMFDNTLAAAFKKIGFPDSDYAINEVINLLSIMNSEKFSALLVIDNFDDIFDDNMCRIFAASYLSTAVGLRYAFILKKLTNQSIINLITKDDALGITKKDFAFSQEDIEDYFRLNEIILDKETSKDIFNKTLGWPYVVHLYMEAYKNKHTDADKTVLDKAYTFIENNVWLELSDDERQFLATMSVFSSFNLNQCMKQTFLEEKMCLKLLNSIPLINYDEHTRRYSFNPMFDGFILQVLDEMPVDEVTKITLRAADTNLDDGNYFEAMKLYSHSKEYRKIYQHNIDFIDIYPYVIKQNKDVFTDIANHYWDIEKEGHYEFSLIICFSLLMFNEKHMVETLLTDITSDICKDSVLSDNKKNSYMAEIQFIKAFTEYNDFGKMREGFNIILSISKSPVNIIAGGFPFNYECPSIMMLYHRQSGALDKELETLEQCAPDYYRITNGHGKGFEALMRADVLYNRGDLDGAEILCQKAIYMADSRNQYAIYIAAWIKDQKKIEDSVNFFSLSFVNIVFGKYLILNREYHHFLGISGQLLGLNNLFSYILPQIYTYIYLAIANKETGETIKAHKFLKEAIKLAEPDRIYMPFVHNYSSISELMAETVIGHDNQGFIRNVIKISKGYEKGVKSIKKAGHALADYGLTVREADVAKLASQRFSNKEIAEQLFIAESTVKSNMKVIFNKLQINSRAELKNFFE